MDVAKIQGTLVYCINDKGPGNLLDLFVYVAAVRLLTLGFMLFCLSCVL